MLCLWCELLIENPRKNQKYHGSCYKEYRRDYKRKSELTRRKNNRLSKICLFCGKKWIPKHGNIKYCSDSCKNDFKAKLQGFSSKHEKTSLKKYKCPECGSKLVQDHYKDKQTCIMCGYSKRTIPKVSVANEKAFPKITLRPSVDNAPVCLEFQHIRGKNQEQNLIDHKDPVNYIPIFIGDTSPLFCKCGMLITRCICKNK